VPTQLREYKDMALKKRGKWWYGESQSDIRDELIRYGKLNEYVPVHFADAKCACGSNTFRLCIDDNEGAAVRICPSCATEHPIGDSDEYLDEAELDLKQAYPVRQKLRVAG